MTGSTYTLNPDQCPSCVSGILQERMRVVTPYLDHRECYDIKICDQCGHGVAIGRSDLEYLSQIYADGFFASDQQAIESATSPINRNAMERAENLSRTCSGRVLDIGAGNGAFLRAARTKGFAIDGVEFSTVAASKARDAGFTVFEGDFFATDFQGASYDLITLWDVLASLHQPAEVLEKCFTLLQDDGSLVMTLPMIDSKIARLLGARWALMIPPVNLHFFTRQSIRQLIERAGFELQDIRTESKKVSLNFIAIKAVRSFRLHFLEPIVTKLVPNWNVTLNTGDIATVTLCKKRT